MRARPCGSRVVSAHKRTSCFFSPVGGQRNGASDYVHVLSEIVFCPDWLSQLLQDLLEDPAQRIEEISCRLPGKLLDTRRAAVVRHPALGVLGGGQKNP